MSDIPTNEIDSLKQRLDTMGVKYHPNTGVEKLRTLLNTALSDETPIADSVVSDDEEKPAKPVKKAGRDESMALKRVFVSCHNPSKTAWSGEIFSVNGVKKYVAFNQEWHIPTCIYNYLKEKQFQQFYSEKNKHGKAVRKARLVREFNIEDLEPLTEKQLKELAQRQAMAAGNADAV